MHMEKCLTYKFVVCVCFCGKNHQNKVPEIVTIDDPFFSIFDSFVLSQGKCAIVNEEKKISSICISGLSLKAVAHYRNITMTAEHQQSYA